MGTLKIMRSAYTKERKKGRNANLKMKFLCKWLISLIHVSSLSISFQARHFPFQRHRQELLSHQEMTAKLPKRNWKGSKRTRKCKAHYWVLLITVIPSLHINLLSAGSSFPQVLKLLLFLLLLTQQIKISGGEFISVKKKNLGRPIWGRTPSKTF